jgi:hypothetical protein
LYRYTAVTYDDGDVEAVTLGAERVEWLAGGKRSRGGGDDDGEGGRGAKRAR